MNKEDISASELRNKLYETFKNSGVENSLKAQMRIQLVRMLKKKSLTPENVMEAPLLLRAINSLFVDYLQHVNYQYTLSVFLPESGMSNQVLSRADVINVLHLEGDSKLIQNMKQADENNTDSLITQLFHEMGKLHPSKSDKDVQTDTPPESLDKKLRHLEDDFFHKSEVERKAPYRSLEERMLKYQRDCDERSKAEIQTEITRFKEVELSRMRLEESGKFREILNREREELERKVQEKYEKLRQREQEQTENLQKKEQDLLKLDYDQRQKVIRDMEGIKSKENDIRREREMFAREMRMGQERMKEREEALNSRLDEAHRIVDDMRAKYDADLELYKANYQKSLDDERASVQRERAQLMDEMKRFEKDKEPHAKMFERIWRMEEEAKINQQKLRVSHDHCEHLNSKLHQMQEEVDRMTLLSTNLSQVRPPVPPPPLDSSELLRLKSMLDQAQLAKERAENELERVRLSSHEISDLQSIHEQELQDLIDDHKAAIQRERNKISILEQELQREKQKLRDELRKEADIRTDLGRMLDDRELELAHLKIQFGLPPVLVPMPYAPGAPRPIPTAHFMAPPPQEAYPDSRFGIPHQHYPQQHKFDPSSSGFSHPSEKPINYQIPPQPKESDSWKIELNKTLNGILQLEKDDMRVQQKYYDAKSADIQKKERVVERVERQFTDNETDEEEMESSKSSKRKGKIEKGKKEKGEKEGKAKKGDKKSKAGKTKKDKENLDSNKEESEEEDEDEEEAKPKKKEKGKKGKAKKDNKEKKGKKEEDEESEDEIDKKLREMELREKEERERVERETKAREERQRREKEELERREKEIKEREDKLREEREKQRQDEERRKLEQELSVLRRMKEEEEEKRQRERKEEEESKRRKQLEIEREMTMEKERRDREERKAQEILSQIRERREREKKPPPKTTTDSDFSDLDFGEVADMLDGCRSDSFSV